MIGKYSVLGRNVEKYTIVRIDDAHERTNRNRNTLLLSVEWIIESNQLFKIMLKYKQWPIKTGQLFGWKKSLEVRRTNIFENRKLINGKSQNVSTHNWCSVDLRLNRWLVQRAVLNYANWRNKSKYLQKILRK